MRKKQGWNISTFYAAMHYMVQQRPTREIDNIGADWFKEKTNHNNKNTNKQNERKT